MSVTGEGSRLGLEIAMGCGFTVKECTERATPVMTTWQIAKVKKYCKDLFMIVKDNPGHEF